MGWKLGPIGQTGLEAIDEELPNAPPSLSHWGDVRGAAVPSSRLVSSIVVAPQGANAPPSFQSPFESKAFPAPRMSVLQRAEAPATLSPRRRAWSFRPGLNAHEASRAAPYRGSGATTIRTPTDSVERQARESRRRIGSSAGRGARCGLAQEPSSRARVEELKAGVPLAGHPRACASAPGGGSANRASRVRRDPGVMSTKLPVASDRQLKTWVAGETTLAV